MNNAFDLTSFREKLEAHATFPTLYMFKFIVPKGREAEIGSLLPNNEMKLKVSSKGTYVSATIQALMPNSEAIIDVYLRAANIEGVIAL
ncbi:DUF493 family protein [Lunatimonas salinarum]|uniref:DUF493 family protein n=1 Tax=Lunatimonas salinarum TaxID=1774590 RepID=UPI001ADED679|nr:DUF493 family protein [Lunatimonas salinarum]